jgi:hypothetical protein
VRLRQFLAIKPLKTEDKTMKNELIKKLDDLKDKYGDVDGIVLTREAFHACHPDRPHAWKCDAVLLEGHVAITGYVWWDFEADTEDAADLPWDIAAKNDFVPFERFDLTDHDDISDLLGQI